MRRRAPAIALRAIRLRLALCRWHTRALGAAFWHEPIRRRAPAIALRAIRLRLALCRWHTRVFFYSARRTLASFVELDYTAARLFFC